MLGMRPAVSGATENEVPPEPSLADLQALADAFTGGKLRLRNPVWLTYFRLHHRQATHYRAGRVFLAGDAAHVHSPAGAQGMNTGIQDAWNLGWTLALVDRGLADAALLDSYEPERWPIGRFVLRFTDRPTAIATSGSPVVRLIRTEVAPRLAPLVLRPSRVRAYGFRTLAQLRIHYRGSPAVHEGQPALRYGPGPGIGCPTLRSSTTGASAGCRKHSRSTARTMVASMRTATARPMPISFMSRIGNVSSEDLGESTSFGQAASSSGFCAGAGRSGNRTSRASRRGRASTSAAPAASPVTAAPASASKRKWLPVATMTSRTKAG
jgi:hypothetical protein